MNKLGGKLELYRLLMVAGESADIDELYLELRNNGFTYFYANDSEEIIAQIDRQLPDAVLVTIDSHAGKNSEICRKIKQEKRLPVIALINRDSLDNFDLDTDDFITQPYEIKELLLRLRRLLPKTKLSETGELIRRGDLLIDLAQYEVTVGGRLAELTFREYELLKFMASHPGRVFTREVLLDRVWGYDYFGGDRTVDVYIRRLRSKIEDANHSFIDTIRNIGYRFKES